MWLGISYARVITLFFNTLGTQLNLTLSDLARENVVTLEELGPLWSLFWPLSITEHGRVCGYVSQRL